jgi:hypothetical protein
MNRAITCLSTLFLSIVLLTNQSSLNAWDSESHNPTHSTHSYFTEWSIGQLQDNNPELTTYKEALIKGSNAELHELPIRDYEKKLANKYSLDLEALRLAHQGTNEGCNDIKGWWEDCIKAYKSGNKQQAYFFLGVILHMIQDMGVPAHANKVVHQGNLTEFDNFEFLAVSNWKPKYDDINKADPKLDEPWKYYEFSQAWTKEDAPDYHNRDTFSKFWITASSKEKNLLSNRQGRTCLIVKWTLESAINAFRN